MNGLVLRDRTLEGVEEPDELLVPVAGHVAADDGAVEHIERSEQRRRPVPLVVVGHGAEPPFLHRQAWLGAIKRLNLRLLIDAQHHGMRRWVDIEPDDVVELLGKGRIGGELEAPPAVRREAMRLPDVLDGRDRQAAGLGHRLRRPVRRLRRGGGASVRRTTSATRAASTGALPGGRVLSRKVPPTPAAMNRSCQRQTVVFDLPVAAMMAFVPKPSAVSSMIRARQTCFCGVLRSLTMVSRRRRSAAETEMEMPLRMPQTSHAPRRKGIPIRTLPFRLLH